MKTRRIFQIVIATILVITTTCFAQRGGEQREKPTPDQIVERMTEKLSLTEDQQVSIKALYTDFFAETEELRESGDRSTMRESMKNLKTELDEDIKALLTEDQITGFEKMQSNRAKRSKDSRESRGSKGSGERQR